MATQMRGQNNKRFCFVFSFQNTLVSLGCGLVGPISRVKAHIVEKPKSLKGYVAESLHDHVGQVFFYIYKK